MCEFLHSRQALKIEHNPNVTVLHEFEQLEGSTVKGQGLKQERCGFAGRFCALCELANTFEDSSG